MHSADMPVSRTTWWARHFHPVCQSSSSAETWKTLSPASNVAICPCTHCFAHPSSAALLDANQPGFPDHSKESDWSNRRLTKIDLLSGIGDAESHDTKVHLRSHWTPNGLRLAPVIVTWLWRERKSAARSLQPVDFRNTSWRCYMEHKRSVMAWGLAFHATTWHWKHGRRLWPNSSRRSNKKCTMRQKTIHKRTSRLISTTNPSRPVLSIQVYEDYNSWNIPFDTHNSIRSQGKKPQRTGPEAVAWTKYISTRTGEVYIA